MNTVPKMLIVDDDNTAIQLMTFKLRERFPNLEIDTRTTPNVEGNYDIYILDNDFAGNHAAGRLAHTIRIHNPGALVIAVSASLDVTTLKTLLNEGCYAACDKNSPCDEAMALDTIDRFLQLHAIQSAGLKSTGKSLTSIVREITQMLCQWNARLSHAKEEEAQSVPTGSR
jgi:hypothetical protein